MIGDIGVSVEVFKKVKGQEKPDRILAYGRAIRQEENASDYLRFLADYIDKHIENSKGPIIIHK